MRRALLFVMFVSCFGCHGRGPGRPEPPTNEFEIDQQPVLKPFAKANRFLLTQPLVIRVGEGRDSLVVPSGFVTDFASIPKRLRGFISKLGPHLCPAIVHDYLYSEQVCTRAQADAIFLKMMEDLGVSWLTRRVMYWSVRWFGRSAWDQNTKWRMEGMPRIVPPNAREFEPSETWSHYREYLTTVNGHYSPPPRISPGFCSYANGKKSNGG